MRGTAYFRDWEKPHWIAKIKADIERLNILPLYEDSSIKQYTEENICPAQLYEILEELGWIEFDESRDQTRCDRWRYYINFNYPERKLCAYASGLTFALRIYFVD